MIANNYQKKAPYFPSSFSTWPPIVINFVPWNIWNWKWNLLNQIAISKHSLFQLRSWKVKCVAWFETNGFRFPLCKQTPLKSSLQSWGKPISKGRLQKTQSRNSLGRYPTPASMDRISPINQQKSFMDQGGTVPQWAKIPLSEEMKIHLLFWCIKGIFEC